MLWQIARNLVSCTIWVGMFYGWKCDDDSRPASAWPKEGLSLSHLFKAAPLTSNEGDSQAALRVGDGSVDRLLNRAGRWTSSQRHKSLFDDSRL
jgi:hypothetical protein